MNKFEHTMEKLSDEAISDFKEMVANAEALLKATTNQGGEKMAEIRAKAEDSIRIAKARMSDAEAAVLAQTRAAAKATDVYVHKNPWQAIGVAAGFCLVIGLIFGSRR